MSGVFYELRRTFGGAGEVRLREGKRVRVLHAPPAAIRLWGGAYRWGTEGAGSALTAAAILWEATENAVGAVLAAGDLNRLWIGQLPRRSICLRERDVLGYCAVAVALAERRELHRLTEEAKREGGFADE